MSNIVDYKGKHFLYQSFVLLSKSFYQCFYCSILVQWNIGSDDMRFKYCKDCGAFLRLKEIGDEGLVPFCDSCDKPLFDYAPVCILTMVINQDNEVALLKQNYVSETHLVFVAGYYKPGESAEDTVRREIFEEIGLVAQDIEFIKTHYIEKLDTLFLLYITHVIKAPFRLSDEVDEVSWYKLPIDETLLNEKGVAYMIYQAYKAHDATR